MAKAPIVLSLAMVLALGLWTSRPLALRAEPPARRADATSPRPERRGEWTEQRALTQDAESTDGVEWNDGAESNDGAETNEPVPSPEPVGDAPDPAEAPPPDLAPGEGDLTPGEEPCPQGGWLRAQDEFWLVSTREHGLLPCGAGLEPRLVVHRLGGDLRWRRVDMADFFAAAKAPRKTVFYVHGNRVESAESVKRGAYYYRQLARAAGEEALRLVVWSWPSEQTGGPLRDVRTKASRSDCEAYALAWVLSRLPTSTPVSLIGYSFGARLILGAQHLLGGGALACRSLGLPADAETVRTRASLLASAAHDHWLSPEQRLGRAWRNIDRLLLINNSADPVLKRYRLLERDHADAMGHAGVVGAFSREMLRRVDQRDAANIVGRHHDEYRYMYSPALMGLIRDNALWR